MVSTQSYAGSGWLDVTSTTTYVGRAYQMPSVIKKETKKQRIARIAKEKMYASWNTVNEKPCNIVQVMRVCKPIHKIKYQR